MEVLRSLEGCYHLGGNVVAYSPWDAPLDIRAYVYKFRRYLPTRSGLKMDAEMWRGLAEHSQVISDCFLAEEEAEIVCSDRLMACVRAFRRTGELRLWLYSDIGGRLWLSYEQWIALVQAADDITCSFFPPDVHDDEDLPVSDQALAMECKQVTEPFLCFTGLVTCILLSILLRVMSSSNRSPVDMAANRFPMGDDRFANVFQARFVGIRQFQQYPDCDRWYPTRNGTCLTSAQWTSLLEVKDNILKDLADRVSASRVVSPELTLEIKPGLVVFHKAGKEPFPVTEKQFNALMLWSNEICSQLE